MLHLDLDQTANVDGQEFLRVKIMAPHPRDLRRHWCARLGARVTSGQVVRSRVFVVRRCIRIALRCSAHNE